VRPEFERSFGIFALHRTTTRIYRNNARIFEVYTWNRDGTILIARDLFVLFIPLHFLSTRSRSLLMDDLLPFPFPIFRVIFLFIFYFLFYFLSKDFIHDIVETQTLKIRVRYHTTGSKLKMSLPRSQSRPTLQSDKDS